MIHVVVNPPTTWAWGWEAVAAIVSAITAIVALYVGVRAHQIAVQEREYRIARDKAEDEAARLGQARYVAVSTQRPFAYRGPTREVSILVQNLGDRPVFDAHLVAAEHGGQFQSMESVMLTRRPGAASLGALGPQSSIDLDLPAPEGFSMTGGEVTLRYGVAFRDASGVWWIAVDDGALYEREPPERAIPRRLNAHLPPSFPSRPEDGPVGPSGAFDGHE